MNMDPIAATSATRALQQELLIAAFGDRIKAAEGDLASAKSLIQEKNKQITRLETENVRLKMERADKELRTQVEGLRTEVGKKDAALVAHKRQIDIFLENEKVILRRAASAEAKVLSVQETLVRMQRSRDAAQAEVEVHDKARIEAVGQMVSAADRARKLEERLAEIEKKSKSPIAPPSAHRTNRK